MANKRGASESFITSTPTSNRFQKFIKIGLEDKEDSDINVQNDIAICDLVENCKSKISQSLQSIVPMGRKKRTEQKANMSASDSSKNIGKAVVEDTMDSTEDAEIDIVKSIVLIMQEIIPTLVTSITAALTDTVKQLVKTATKRIEEELRQELNLIRYEQDRLEQSSRQNLRIIGLPESSSADNSDGDNGGIKKEILQLAQTMEVELDERDILDCYRLGRPGVIQ